MLLRRLCAQGTSLVGLLDCRRMSCESCQTQSLRTSGRMPFQHSLVDRNLKTVRYDPTSSSAYDGMFSSISPRWKKSSDLKPFQVGLFPDDQIDHRPSIKVYLLHRFPHSKFCNCEMMTTRMQLRFLYSPYCQFFCVWTRYLVHRREFRTSGLFPWVCSVLRT